MELLIWSAKGGCGKTSISTAILQTLGEYQIITNDKMNPYNLILDKEQYYLLPDNKEIPVFDDDVNLIYDFGGYGDKRIPEFISKSKKLKILIPFNPDVVSFQAAISIYNEIKLLNDKIYFIINRAKKGDYEIFSNQMKKLNINNPLFEIKESKLFSNIFNKQETINQIKNDSLLSYSYKQVLNQINEILKGIEK